jgi:hypothetical protein
MKVKSLPKNGDRHSRQTSRLWFATALIVTMSIFMIFQTGSISVSTALAQQLE